MTLQQMLAFNTHLTVQIVDFWVKNTYDSPFSFFIHDANGLLVGAMEMSVDGKLRSLRDVEWFVKQLAFPLVVTLFDKNEKSWEKTYSETDCSESVDFQNLSHRPTE